MKQNMKRMLLVLCMAVCFFALSACGRASEEAVEPISPEIEQTMQALRQFMFERVYKNPVAKGEESKARRILQELYTYYIAHPEALPQDFQPQLTFEGLPRVVCDYIAGMTDKYAMYKYDELFIPTGWQVRG